MEGINGEQQASASLPRHKLNNKGELSWLRRRKKVHVADVAVDWESYFKSIRQVCPWSWAAWKKQQITITNWHSQIFELGNFQARLYIAPNHNARQLKKISNRLNRERPHEEWLWSHPDFAHNSTPVPVFIQQDRLILERARNG